jgi:hypothetical protein
MLRSDLDAIFKETEKDPIIIREDEVSPNDE